jgi:hypothetical protein
MNEKRKATTPIFIEKRTDYELSGKPRAPTLG